MFLGIILLLIFAIFAVLMYLNKLPALLALPIMAVLIAVFAGIPPKDIVTNIIADGATRLNVAIITILFGSMLSMFVNNSGIAQTLIKKTAELAGDSPFFVSLAMTLIVALLFTVLGGLGSVIMVATIVLPIFLSIGVSRMVAGCLFLLGISMGGIFNLTNWQLYISVIGLTQSQILSYALLLGAASLVITVAFLIIQLKIQGTSIGWSELLEDEKPKFVSWPATLTPIIPLALVLGFSLYNFIYKPSIPFEFPIVTAMIAGLLWGFFTTLKKGSVNMLSKSVFDGISSVAPAVALIMGIGMVLNSVMHPAVAYVISPMLVRIMPSTPIQYIIFFSVLAPLALYRGPLNIWGMGAGLVGLMVAAKTIPPITIAAALMSVGQLQGVCDPTNTHNVWIANYLNLNVQDILKKTILYMWLLAVIGLFIAGFAFF